MKKLILGLLLFLLLVSCQQQGETIESDAQVTLSDTITAQYTLPNDDEDEEQEILEFAYRLPEITTLNDDNEPTGNAIPAYSIDPTFDFENSEPTVLEAHNFYAVDELDTAIKDRLFWIAYYGYGYYELSESGLSKLETQEELTQEDYVVFHGDFDNNHNLDNDINWYLAAQELIWESFSDEDGNPYEASFKTNLSSYKEAILALVNTTYQTIPQFGGSVITINQSDVDNQTIYDLSDQNQKLHLFNVFPPKGLEILNIDNYDIEVQLLDYTDDLALSFVRHDRFESHDSTIYHNIDNQRFITFGNSRLATLATKFHFEMDDNLVGVSLSITNIAQEDSNIILYGAQYEIADDIDFSTNVVKSTVSEEGVNARFNNLTQETFYLRQISAPEGYGLSEEIKEVSVPTGASKLSITFVNELEVIDPEANNNE